MYKFLLKWKNAKHLVEVDKEVVGSSIEFSSSITKPFHLLQN